MSDGIRRPSYPEILKVAGLELGTSALALSMLYGTGYIIGQVLRKSLVPYAEKVENNNQKTKHRQRMEMMADGAWRRNGCLENRRKQEHHHKVAKDLGRVAIVSGVIVIATSIFLVKCARVIKNEKDDAKFLSKFLPRYFILCNTAGFAGSLTLCIKALFQRKRRQQRAKMRALLTEEGLQSFQQQQPNEEEVNGILVPNNLEANEKTNDSPDNNDHSHPNPEPQPQRLCIICMERQASCAFIPCGHRNVCVVCSRQLLQRGGSRQCPTCRSICVRIVKIYDVS